MKQYAVYLIAFFSFLLSSCGGKKIVNFPVDFITIHNDSSIKEDFMKLVEPFECTAIKDKIFVCYPLKVERLDVKNSTATLDYESNKSVGYNKIAAVRQGFNNFFETVYSDSLFLATANQTFSLDNYLAMPNVFILSTKVVGNKSLNGKKIYSTVSALRDELCNYVFKNNGKIIILYNVIQNAANLRENTNKNQDVIAPKPSSSGGVNMSQCEELYVSLASKKKKATAQNFSTLDAELKNAQALCATDYRFTYERVNYSIIGHLKHEVAFNLLSQAAELAIKFGKADEMHKRLQQDKHGDLEKLSDHKEFGQIHAALEKENIKALPIH